MTQSDKVNTLEQKVHHRDTEMRGAASVNLKMGDPAHEAKPSNSLCLCGENF